MSQLPNYEFVSVPIEEASGQKQPGVPEREISNIFIPDLPIGVAPEDLVEINSLLAATAAAVFLRHPGTERGRIVGGESIRTRQPEVAGRAGKNIIDRLTDEGVPRGVIEYTATGVDPVTNFIRAQKLFETNAPVGIVTPAKLWPLHEYIAERTMRRAYGGLRVHGIPHEERLVHWSDGRRSRHIARGQTPLRPNLLKAQGQALRAKKVASLLPHSGARFYGS